MRINHPRHLVFVASLLLCISGFAQTFPVPNPDFETGDQTPDGWRVVNIPGSWREVSGSDGKCIVAEGDVDTTGYWRTEDLALKPDTLYKLTYRAKRIEHPGGAAITGPVFCSVDQQVSDKWKEYANIFRTPTTIAPGEGWLRFGHWRSPGPIGYDDVQLVEVQPAYRHVDDLVLGDGEQVDGHTYSYNAIWGIALSNDSRPLADFNAFFNTMRFVFGKDRYLTMKHTVGDRTQLSGTLAVATHYHLNGTGIVEASHNGTDWVALGSFDKDKGGVTVDLPASLYPAKNIWIRVRAEADDPLGYDSDMGAFALVSYKYTAQVDGTEAHATGQTRYVSVKSVQPGTDIRVTSLGETLPGDNSLTARIENTTKSTFRAKAIIKVKTDSSEKVTKKRIRIKPGVETVSLPYVVPAAGPVTMTIDIDDFDAAVDFYLADLYRANYGALVPGSSKDVGLWTASSGWKIWQDRPLPKAKTKAVHLSAACNESEATQLVVRPKQALANLSVRVNNLTGPDGATLAASNFDVLLEKYIPVLMPTDYTGAVDMWPDALPPFKTVSCAAGENQPFWVRVKVPKGTPAGTYTGSITLSADNYEASVPLSVEVYGFALADRPTCQTAMSIGWGTIFKYQGVTSDADKRAVVDLYLKDFSDHHVSPYNFTPLDPYVVNWPDIKKGDKVNLDDIKVSVDFTNWDRAMEKAFKTYHFNSFSLPVRGMGGGTFFSRKGPSLLGYDANDPEFKRMYDLQVKLLESHLREKGWLDEAYVYWFDEPDAKDYPFVVDGFERLKQAGPDIRRMLTEQVEDPLVGEVNLWCPILMEYNHARAEERRQHGEEFWWYVCTVPKAPYMGLFIDHGGTELRSWLWETWKNNIDGILIWTTTYWTSPIAYPNSLQNPYEEAMSWVGGYGLAPGSRSPWGNGDGRLVYPPLAAADGHPKSPVVGGPVDSIRWEMIRDGVEDYEYLAMLKRLLTAHTDLSPEQRAKYEALLQVPDDIAKSITEFTKDPRTIEARRDQVAQAVAELTAMK